MAKYKAYIVTPYVLKVETNITSINYFSLGAFLDEFFVTPAKIHVRFLVVESLKRPRGLNRKFDYFWGGFGERRLYYFHPLFPGLGSAQLKFQDMGEGKMEMVVTRNYLRWCRVKFENVWPPGLHLMNLTTVKLLEENLLVLHSACLEIPGKKEGFLVLGSSNTGKSLTAFSFLQNGFQFLSDDMTVLFPPTAYACPFSSGCYSYLSPKDITGRLNQFFLSLPLLGLFVPNLQVRRVFDLLLKRYQVSPKTTVRQIFILERGDKKGVEKLDKEKSFRKIITLNRLELSYFKDHFLYAYSYFNPDFDLNRLLRQEERLVKALVSFCSCFLVRSNNPRDYFSLIKQKLNDF